MSLYDEPVTMFDVTIGADSDVVPLPRIPSLAQILRLEAHLKTLPPLPEDVHHHFADGLYGRELRIPKHAVIVGKMHRQQHLNLLIKGEITVWTEQGMKRLTAPAVIVSQPGCKRVGFAHEDSVWVTVHASKETDLEALEAELIIPEAEFLSMEPARLPGEIA